MFLLAAAERKDEEFITEFNIHIISASVTWSLTTYFCIVETVTESFIKVLPVLALQPGTEYTFALGSDDVEPGTVSEVLGTLTHSGEPRSIIS